MQGNAVLKLDHTNGKSCCPRHRLGLGYSTLCAAPRAVFWSPIRVPADGKRFLMIRRDEGSVPRQLNVILNWPGGPDRLTQSEKK